MVGFLIIILAIINIFCFSMGLLCITGVIPGRQDYVFPFYIAWLITFVFFTLLIGV